jgi:hypothetical protein
MKPSEPGPIATMPDLATIVSDVLGDLAFLIGEDQPAELPAEAQWLECGVSYSGPVGGRLRACCRPALAQQLAASLLGVEPDDDDMLREVAGDALGEFMNVVCGQFLTACYGTGPVFNLSIPTVRESTQMPAMDFTGRGAACRLLVGGEPLCCLWEEENA